MSASEDSQSEGQGGIGIVAVMAFLPALFWLEDRVMTGLGARRIPIDCDHPLCPLTAWTTTSWAVWFVDLGLMLGLPLLALLAFLFWEESQGRLR